MGSRSGSLIEIGKIVGTHGLRGDLKVRLNSGEPEALLKTDQVCLHLPDGDTLTGSPSRQTLHKGQVLLRLHGLESINQVEHLVGSRVMLPKEFLPDLAADEYYWSQIQGLQVADKQRGALGRLDDMFTTAAHDTYVVKGDAGEILIPAVAQFILEIDLKAGVMHVDLPEGLIPQEQ